MASESARAQGIVLPLPPEDQQRINAQLGPGVVVKALPSKPVQETSIYFPLQDEALTYQVTTGPNAGNTQTLGLAKVRRPGGKLAGGFSSRPRSRASSIKHQKVIS